MTYRQLIAPVALAAAVTSLAGWAISQATLASDGQDHRSGDSKAIEFSAPAGDLPATRHINIEGYDGAVLPNGRLITPAGREVAVNAPKPFGLALAPNGTMLATVNSGTGPFSVSLIKNINSNAPTTSVVLLSSVFMGVTFSPDSTRFYAAGGENGMIWVGDTATATAIGSVNLNGSTHAFGAPMNPATNPSGRFRGTYPGNLTLGGPGGRYLYVVEQGSFNVFVVDTQAIVTGVNASGAIIEPNNFAAVVGQAKGGRYPYGIAASNDGRLFVANVGVFQYSHLTPANPTGDSNKDYPLGYPATTWPDDMRQDKTIKIKKVDPRNLPTTLRDPEGIRVGYIDQDLEYTIPGLGSPNVNASSSVYAFSLAAPTAPSLMKRVKTGPLVGEVERGIANYSGSHPNAVAVGPHGIYVSNGNNDSISILDPDTVEEERRVDLSLLHGVDQRIKGVQPVSVALSPDAKYLYVAEAGINAIAVIRLEGDRAARGEVLGHIPTGWWPSAVRVSADGKTLYVANAKGRGAGPNNNIPPDNHGSPKSSTLGTVNIIPVPDGQQLEAYTERVMKNNGFVARDDDGEHQNHRGDHGEASTPIPTKAGVKSQAIKHVIFINKENSTHDQMFGDITMTRKGAPVNGEPSYSLGYDASPNHHELALGFTIGDNFYLEPAVSNDGHRWLTNSYTTEFGETHWPASYGGQRRDAGDDPNVFIPYPGRLGFTDADGSPDPHDYNQHGSMHTHLVRHGVSLITFGNGYEFAQVDEDHGTEPTGIREHVNVPMEAAVRNNADHLFPNYNTNIPDAPLPEDPTRFNRFGRFKQVFESHYVDRKNGVCKLPSFVDLFYPNDHGGGPRDINPNGPDWSYKRYVQDNDAALGMTVELIAKSPCWKDTVFFVVEDDPQNGLDHVDGYRSVFLAIGPWVKHENVMKQHISLASIFKTVNLIFGLPPLNQYDAAATDLRDLFTDKPDFTPYNFKTIQYATKVSPEWLALTKNIDFSRPDADEVKLRDAILRSEGLPRFK
jgi:DNA-binding beta-propeller fold protein YncE